MKISRASTFTSLYGLHFIVFLGCSLLCVFVGACERKGNNTQRASSAKKLINSPGTYLSPKRTYQLTVQVTPNQIVMYQVSVTQTGKTIVSNNAGSHFQRWYFVWDKDEDLWVHSSDIGGGVWILEGGGAPQKVSLTKRSPLPKSSMPRIYFEHLPSVIRKEIEKRVRNHLEN